MKQLTQNLKTGKMEISDVPFPLLQPGNILVKNHFSLISAGTEGSKVETARKSLIGKAKEKPEQLRQVIETLKKEGIFSTFRRVMNKLDALSPLGYSCSGIIIDVGKNVTNFKVGDRVACGGTDAVHGEFVSVPVNLAVKISDNVSFEDAAYTTVAAIAMQGIRQADLSLGENCAIIGLGLIGQLTTIMLKASGVNVVGIDIDERMVTLSKISGVDLALNSNDEKLEQSIKYFTNGYGVDAVIITAGTKSLGPIELAGKIARHKGKVIIVGAVPTGFSRENYYKKELELKMSMSYGPGRYNTNYEEKGLDYPFGYVRWTENRNMQAFINLLHKNKICIKHLTTHVFNFNNALDAYELIVTKKEEYIGILLKYDINSEIKENIVINKKIFKSNKAVVGFIGAGSFAQNFLLPNVPKKYLSKVVTSTSHNCKNIAQKYEFAMACSSVDEITKDPAINTLFVVTRHNTHFEYVMQGLQENKNIFVEKPICLKEEELEQIKDIYLNKNVRLMVGYNRRFAPLIEKIKTNLIQDQPITINYRINAGFIPMDHWTQDPIIGGGRIIGEVCHFIDLSIFLTNSLIKELHSFVIDDQNGLNDNVVISLKFYNNSIANISYFANGSKLLPKEYLELNQNGVTYILNDFKELFIYGKNIKKMKMINQDKGHKKEIELFINSINNGKEAPIKFEEIYNGSLATFKVLESIKTGKSIKI